MATGAVYRIGMLGAGTVGGGVYEILAKRAGSNNMLIAKICVRSLEKTRDFEIDATKTTITTNANDLLSDDIDCLVEVAGGSSGIVKETVLAALKMGKTVVTANKALLAESMGEIQSILMNQPSARIGYEAAVCGGIPIVHTLATCYTGDTIHTIRGICNGTTNFMLSAMAKDVSVSYATILQQAQDLGYAEADPTADVEGHDVRAKIALLAQLAFGGPPPVSLVDDIPCLGISKLTSLDFAVAAQRQATIKLIGVASRPDNTAAASTRNTCSVYVTPMMVSLHNTLARIDGSGNCVTVTSNNMPNGCSFAGPGAGRFPTAHSIMADLDRAATGTLPPTALQVTNPSLTITSDYTADSGWYLRFGGTAADDGSNTTTLATLATLTASAESHQVPLASVHVHDGDGPIIIVTTGPCAHSTIQAFGAANGAALSMPILQ
jgi:homoserine dehydrogenase